jgi:hypothetical protein
MDTPGHSVSTQAGDQRRLELGGGAGIARNRAGPKALGTRSNARATDGQHDLGARCDVSGTGVQALDYFVRYLRIGLPNTAVSGNGTPLRHMVAAVSMSFESVSTV